jgi:hypothetical protein
MVEEYIKLDKIGKRKILSDIPKLSIKFRNFLADWPLSEGFILEAGDPSILCEGGVVSLENLLGTQNLPSLPIEIFNYQISNEDFQKKFKIKKRQINYFPPAASLFYGNKNGYGLLVIIDKCRLSIAHGIFKEKLIHDWVLSSD